MKINNYKKEFNSHGYSGVNIATGNIDSLIYIDTSYIYCKTNIII
jgi:hypothetical protein